MLPGRMHESTALALIRPKVSWDTFCAMSQESSEVYGGGTPSDTSSESTIASNINCSDKNGARSVPRARPFVELQS